MGCRSLIVEIAADGSGSFMTLTQEGIDIADELRQLEEGHTGDTERGWGYMLVGLAGVLGES